MRVVILIFFFYSFLFANISNLEKILNSTELIDTNSTKKIYLKPFNFKCSENGDKVNCISGEVKTESSKKKSKDKNVTTIMSIDEVFTQFKSSILNIKSKKDLSKNLNILKMKNLNFLNKDSNDSVNIRESIFNNNFVNDIYSFPIIGKFGIEAKDITFNMKSDKLETNNSLNIIYNLANFLIKDREKIENSLSYILKHSPKDRYIKIIKDKIPINIDISLQNSPYDKNKIISNLKFIIDAKVFKLESIISLSLTSNDNFENLFNNKKIKKDGKLTNDLIVENLTFSIFDKEGLKEHKLLLQKDKKYKESIETILKSLNKIDSKIYQNSKEAIENLFLGKSDKLIIFVNNKYEVSLSELTPIALSIFMQIALTKDKAKIPKEIEEAVIKYFDIQIVNSEKDIVIKTFDLKNKPIFEGIGDTNTTFIPIEKKDISPAIRFDYTLFSGLKTIKRDNRVLKLIARDRNITTSTNYFLSLKGTNALLFFNLSDKAIDRIFHYLKKKNISIDIKKLNKKYPLRQYEKIYKMGQFIEKDIFLIDGKIENLKGKKYKLNAKKLKKYEWYKLEFTKEIKDISK